ncbi:hypothetical protein BCR33DRAFT_763693 [Rhizoclosmatium globosum]|uniref:Thioredoxin domain-containing protein n=1 Tax=Rhizoclosmatium globosum TaxID=329046 RepID=A0A1Y2CNG4_9FUNG|nr:hypothetical protein BCR33DRAFT_763693 [Rhizoclosmatium globosum]|eukprot:ORY48571.1 hypothetical protein BCR33DRAFT_763693 [Rhizoclosmatium globosum]
MSTTFDLVSVLGEVLHSKGNAEVATASLTKPFIALYFTASWCPPCRKFTPELVNYYLQPHIQEKLDIVVVSRDREESAHDGYFAKMPWLSVPFADRDRAAVLLKKYNVRFIPTFVLIDAATGEIVANDFRGIVEKDPKGHFFPYPAKSIRSILSSVTTVSPHESFNGKYLALFFDSPSFGIDEYTKVDFSAESAAIRTALLQAHTDSKSNNNPFEVLQISLAKTREEHETNAAGVPWPVTAFDETFNTAFHLGRLYNLSFDQPSVVVIDQARNVINRDAALSFKKGAKFPFESLKVVDLNESRISNNFEYIDKPSLIVNLESVKDNAEQVAAFEEILGVVANKYGGGGEVVCTDEYCETSPASEPEVIVFTSKSENSLARYLRTQAGLDEVETKPDAVLYDFNDARVVYPLRADVTKDNLIQFIEDFKSGKLKELKEAENKAKEEAEKAAKEAAETAATAAA